MGKDDKEIIVLMISIIGVLMGFFGGVRDNVAGGSQNFTSNEFSPLKTILERHIEESNLPIIDETFILSISPPYLPNSYLLGNLQEQIKNQSLIDCLIMKESSGNPNAVGDNLKAYGILQFWEGTFNQYSKKYNLDDVLDYKNPQHQIILADKMIQDDFKNVWHWTAAKDCVKKSQTNKSFN